MKVLSIEEAYRYRLAAVYNALNTQLFSKKEQLQAQLHRVDFRLDELKRHKLAIERDMKSEFSAMNERLNSVCGAKQAILQHDISEFSTDSERIANLVDTVEGGAQDMVGFLLKVPALKNTLEVALAKPFRTDIDVSPNDLPRELWSVRETMANFPALQA
jgi:palmitoyltransferase